jgi:chitodextrinase
MKSTMKLAIFFLISLSLASAALRGLATSTLSPSVTAPKWAPKTQYTVGTIVSYNGANYKCIQNHTSLLEWAPNSTPSLWQIVTTTCTAVPAAPTGLNASSTTSSGTTLQWSAVSAPNGCSIIGYNVFQNGVSIYTGVTGTAYTVSGLSGSTSYSFTVAAIDSAGTSGQSNSVSITTAKAAKPAPSPSPAPSPAPTPAPSKQSASSSALEFAPYIDMSLANNNLTAIAAKSGVKKFSLAFVTGSGCTPQWFSQYTIPGENNIKPIISAFGSDNVIISFGGAVGTELAQSCGTVAGTQAAYQAVIDYYGVKNLDFDIEGAGLGIPSVTDIRNQALAGLQKANPGLTISYTLPTFPTGLTYDGVNLLNSAAKYGVNVDIVNLMTMDYGASFDGSIMGQHAINAAKAVVGQIATAGLKARVGITPMIGINDVQSEVFSLANAAEVASYAKSNTNTIGRLAMWSIARDNGSCVGSLSYGCSGVSQSDYAFAQALNV